MSAPSSFSDERASRVRSSARLAAYGDALGFIAELTDRRGLRRRAQVDHVSTTVPWKRRIGGQFGPTVTLPAGAISDDTQLRLATSRSMLPSGAFDVDTFSKIELAIWPAYALGAGRGSLAAAAGLRKRDVTWATNFFKSKGVDYLQGGGNGAAMRIQPHVWATPPSAGPLSWLGDVLVNAVCTHGHPRGYIGAAFHAACVDHAMRHRRPPTAEQCRDLADALRISADVARNDDRLTEIWLGQWEHAARPIDEAVEEVVGEIQQHLKQLEDLEPGRPGAYSDAVERLQAFDPRHRGSGSRTAVLAACASWLYEDHPEAGLRACADAVGTDTDSIATMVGAVLGATRPVGPEGEVQDDGYLAVEADRMSALAEGLRPARFPYPDLLNWRPPRAGNDVFAQDGDQVSLAGLGPVQIDGETFHTSGKTTDVWRWAATWFGQSLLVKHREPPVQLVDSQSVTPSAAYGTQIAFAARADRPELAAVEKAANRQEDPDPDRPGESRSSVPRSRRTLNDITDAVIAAGLTDAAIGAGLREVAARHSAIEDGIAFNAIVVKALIARERRQAR